MKIGRIGVLIFSFLVAALASAGEDAQKASLADAAGQALKSLGGQLLDQLDQIHVRSLDIVVRKSDAEAKSEVSVSSQIVATFSPGELNASLPQVFKYGTLQVQPTVGIGLENDQVSAMNFHVTSRKDGADQVYTFHFSKGLERTETPVQISVELLKAVKGPIQLKFLVYSVEIRSKRHASSQRITFIGNCDVQVKLAQAGRTKPELFDTRCMAEAEWDRQKGEFINYIYQFGLISTVPQRI